MLIPRYTLRGHSMAVFQAALAVMVLAGLLILQLTASAAPDAATIWIADHKTLKRVDPATNQYLQGISLANTAEAIAFDARKDVLWALANKHLLKFAANSVLAADLDLAAQLLPTEVPKRLTLDPYDGSLWVGGEKTVLHISAQGQVLLKWTSSQNIQAINLDPDQSLWVLTQNGLYQLSVAGTVLSNLVLPVALVPDPSLLAIDGLGGYLWVAGKKTLVRFDANDLTTPPLSAAVPTTVNGTTDKLEMLHTHPLFGTVWAVSNDILLLYDRDTSLIRQVSLSPQALGNFKAISYEQGSASLWLGGNAVLGRFTPSGDYVSKLPADVAISAISTGPFSVSPKLTLLAPVDSSFTNNPRPPFRLGLGAECNGEPCELVDAYTKSFIFDATLNGIAVETPLTFSNREVLYIPPSRLPEGANFFSAQAEDIFGHLSNRLTSKVTVDTVPPKFLRITPTDGSVISTEKIIISGIIDDPSASVPLQNQAGQVLGMASGARFSFAVALKPGANMYTLTAQDPVGNATRISYRLTLNTKPDSEPSPTTNNNGTAGNSSASTSGVGSTPQRAVTSGKLLGRSVSLSGLQGKGTSKTFAGNTPPQIDINASAQPGQGAFVSQPNR